MECRNNALTGLGIEYQLPNLKMKILILVYLQVDQQMTRETFIINLH